MTIQATPTGGAARANAAGRLEGRRGLSTHPPAFSGPREETLRARGARRFARFGRVFSAGFVAGVASTARVRLVDGVLGALAAGLLEERETAAERRERQRILNLLHDGAKQNVRGTSMMIAACIQAQEAGNPQGVRDLLLRTLDMSQEAARQLHRPFEETDGGPEPGGAGTAASLGRKFRGLLSDFGIEVHEDVGADLGLLGEGDLAVADKVCTEAVWNAVKHSGARVVRFESERAGRTLTLRVRDDGVGFSPGSVADGFGLGLMRLRAEDAGVCLEVTSAPGAGTSVALRFQT